MRVFLAISQFNHQWLTTEPKKNTAQSRLHSSVFLVLTPVTYRAHWMTLACERALMTAGLQESRLVSGAILKKFTAHCTKKVQKLFQKSLLKENKGIEKQYTTEMKDVKEYLTQKRSENEPLSGDWALMAELYENRSVTCYTFKCYYVLSSA